MPRSSRTVRFAVRRRLRQAAVVAAATMAASLLPLPAGSAPAYAVSTRLVTASAPIVDDATTVALPAPARFVALSWLGAHDADVRVATSADGISYAAARSVGRDGVEVEDDPRTWSAVMFAPGTTAVRITTDEALRDVQVSAIADSAARVVRAVPGDRPASAAVTQPDVVSRSEWGADESQRSQTYATNPANFHPVSKLLVHHTGEDPTATQPNAEEQIRAIYRFHVSSRGFSDIGYNFLVSADGRVFEGRYARVYDLGEEPTGEDRSGRGITGAHASNHNAGTAGVAMLGNFVSAEPTPTAVSALVEILAWKAERHGIDPRGRSLYDNPASSSDVPRAFANIAGHRDVGSTECPGGLLYAMLPSIRDRVAERIAVGGPGPSATASPTPSASPEAPRGGGLNPTDPTRLLDTREGGGSVRGGTSRALQVAGRAGLPTSGIRAAVLNVTVTEPTGSGFLTLHPGGTSRPTASNLNFVAGQTVANSVTVGLGTDGTVSIYASAGAAHVVADLVGWYADESLDSGSLFAPLAPARLLDTRAVAGGGALAGGVTRELAVTGRDGVPDRVDAVLLNVTAVTPTRAGFLTVHPAGISRPTASSLNFAAGDVRPNLVLAKVGAGGRVAFYNQAGATHLVVDVVGWFGAPGVTSARGRFTAITPGRALSTRPASALAGGETRTLFLAGVAGVPTSGAGAVLLNVTVDAPTASGYLTVHPGGSAAPMASNLNFRRGQTVPNAVAVGLDDAGAIELTNASGDAHVIVDVAGWFSI